MSSNPIAGYDPLTSSSGTVRTFRPTVALAFLAAMAILVGMEWFSYRSTATLISTSSWINHAQGVIANLDELQTRITHAESAQGRFLLTGDRTFLRSFDQDVQLTREIERRVAELTSDNPEQQNRIRQLETRIDAKISYMTREVQRRQSGPLTEEIQREVATEGRRRMDDVQSEIADMAAAERRLLATRNVTESQSAVASLRGILIGGGLALIFLACAGFVLQRDVRKRQVIAAQLQQTTALQRAILNSANYGIISTDANGVIRSLNSAAEKMFGYHSSEVAGRLKPESLHDPLELEEHAQQLSRFLGEKVTGGFDALIAKARLGSMDENEWTFTRRDGSKFAGLLSTSAMHDERGEITGFVFVVSDITRRKEAEKAKEQIERRYRGLLQNSSDMVSVIDPSSRILYISPAVKRLLDFEAQELDGREFFELVHPSDVDLARLAFYEMGLHPGYSQPSVLRLRKSDGESVSVEIVGNNLLDDPVLHGIVLNARDITERSRARSQLEVQNAVARVLSQAENLEQSIPDILQVLCNNLDWELSEFWAVDKDQRDLQFNYAWSLPGFQLRAFLEVSQHTTIKRGEGLAGRVWQSATAIQVPDISHEENFVRRTEVEALSLRTAVGFPIRSREAVIGVFTLFSLRTRHVDADFLAMLNTVGAQIGQFIARKRAEKEITENEDRYHYLFENSADLIVTFAPDGSILHPNAAWVHALGYSREELMNMNLLDVIAPENREAFRAELDIILGGGSVEKVEMTLHSRHGRHIIVEGTIGCRFGATGVQYCNAIFQDVTKRREIDRMKNEFISVVSHELRTPLTSIRGSLGLIGGGMLRRDPDKADRMLDIALKNTERLVRLINDILDIEKIESGKIALDMQFIDASDLLTQASATMHAMAENNQVQLKTNSIPGKVYADRDRMLQTLTNLLSNAIKFSKPGSTVSLSSERRGGGVLIRVRDTGRGIPADKLQTIFERFQQVDASDSREKGGTGLGLAICRSIVQQHGGSIWVTSVEGKGSEFFVLLPRFQSEGGPVAISAEEPNLSAPN